jgi:hypothetical protein
MELGDAMETDTTTEVLNTRIKVMVVRVVTDKHLSKYPESPGSETGAFCVY